MTIFACVNRHTGAARVFTHLPRCHRHETRIAWNTPGPAGRNGATGKTGAQGKQGATGKNGTNGTNGENGAVNGYAATQAESLPITTEPGSVVSRELPAGHYVVTTKLTVSASAKEVGGVQVECKLLLATATGESHLDSSTWIAPLVSFTGSEYLAADSLSLDAVVNLTTAGTVSVRCETIHAMAKEEAVNTSNGQLVVVQTTKNS
ncbi:MAG TPA: collagen-like protein [Solirubrobacteraceae bacterium]|nr:collagen-like protein [Solirubrobacteraceae bacterium]